MARAKGVSTLTVTDLFMGHTPRRAAARSLESGGYAFWSAAPEGAAGAADKKIAPVIRTAIVGSPKGLAAGRFSLASRRAGSRISAPWRYDWTRHPPRPKRYASRMAFDYFEHAHYSTEHARPVIVGQLNQEKNKGVPVTKSLTTLGSLARSGREKCASAGLGTERRRQCAVVLDLVKR